MRGFQRVLTMNLRPYTYRLMACLPGDTPIEIHRSPKQRLSMRDWQFWTRGLSDAWEVWAEYTLGDKQTLTPRIYPHRATGPERLHLTPQEKKQSGVMGDLP